MFVNYVHYNEREIFMKFAAALVGALVLVCLLISGCGEDGEEGSESFMWLTETSLEDPGAWFSVSILPVE